MESPAKQITVYPGKMVEGLWAALALVAGFGATALATRRKLLTRLSKRANEEHRDHVAHILMVGQRVPGYEEAFENLESMTEEEALEVFVCMARRSARWDRAYGRGDDPFGEVQQFLDRMPAGRMADQKMDLFRRLALEAFDKLEQRSAFPARDNIRDDKDEVRVRRQDRGYSGDHRLALQSEAVNDRASEEYRIKGKISSKGERIYHVPGGQWYDRAKIDPSKGERWFRSEAEARAAGWRPARQ